MYLIQAPQQPGKGDQSRSTEKGKRDSGDSDSSTHCSAVERGSERKQGDPVGAQWKGVPVRLLLKFTEQPLPGTMCVKETVGWNGKSPLLEPRLDLCPEECAGPRK